MPQAIIVCDLACHRSCLQAPVRQNKTLSEQARLLNATLGIGPTVLTALLKKLAELCTLCRSKIASL